MRCGRTNSSDTLDELETNTNEIGQLFLVAQRSPCIMYTNLLNTAALSSLLSSMLSGGEPDDFPGRIVSREPNPYSDTYTSEIVTLDLENRINVRLFCKYYDGAMRRDLGHGHRGGLSYEGEVYRRLLSKLEISVPIFYGAHTDHHSGATVLVLGYIDGATRVHKAPQWISRMTMAARWLGRFHNATTEVILELGRQFLIRYDREYYVAWSNRTRLYTTPVHTRFPWIPAACDYFEDSVDYLLRLQETVIHGKFNPKEVLIRGEDVYPVDWESAAIGVGVIDLAMFVDGWPCEEVRQWVRAYQNARWPSGVPHDFDRLFDIAQLYVQMRWLGDHSEWTVRVAETDRPWRFQKVRALLEQMS